MPASLYLAPGVLERLVGGTLFYPGAGGDFRVPLALFAPLLAEFWFVDRGYFTPNQEDTRELGLDRPPAESPPLLAGNRQYRLSHRTLEGELPPAAQAGAPAGLVGLRRVEPAEPVRPEIWPRRQVERLILTEHYLHRQSGRSFRIHRCRGDALEVFEQEPRLSALSVFFYRGDSAGEGGSGIRWLGQRLERAVLDRLLPGGLFVSDGSDGAMFPQRGRSGFRNPAISGVRHDVASAVARVEPICGANEQILRCVGYAGPRYGKTLVWQKPAAGDDDGIRHAIRMNPFDDEEE